MYRPAVCPLHVRGGAAEPCGPPWSGASLEDPVARRAAEPCGPPRPGARLHDPVAGRAAEPCGPPRPGASLHDPVTRRAAEPCGPPRPGASLHDPVASRAAEPCGPPRLRARLHDPIARRAAEPYGPPRPRASLHDPVARRAAEPWPTARRRLARQQRQGALDGRAERQVSPGGRLDGRHGDTHGRRVGAVWVYRRGHGQRGERRLRGRQLAQAGRTAYNTDDNIRKPSHISLPSTGKGPVRRTTGTYGTASINTARRKCNTR